MILRKQKTGENNMKAYLVLTAVFVLICFAAMTFESSGSSMYLDGVNAACHDLCK
jgi:hypothetical protein